MQGGDRADSPCAPHGPAHPTLCPEGDLGGWQDTPRFWQWSHRRERKDLKIGGESGWGGVVSPIPALLQKVPAPAR